MIRRRILAVTGIRSDYDLMTPVYRALERRGDVELLLAVTGAHLAPAFGRTIDEIRHDGFTVVDTIESLLAADRLSSRVKGLGIQLQGLVQTVERVAPDMLLVLGDREESISTALVGAYMNVPVAHVAGGDRVVGNVDDQVRHAVTKLAHLHFAMTQESRERLLRLGEQPFRVSLAGHPGIDRLLETPDLDGEQLSRALGYPLDGAAPLLLVIQHVISTEVDEAYEQMRSTLAAVAGLGIQTVLVYPNSDAGSYEIMRAIKEFEDIPHVRPARNLPRLAFVNVMRRASCLLGNSSAGIMEAPALHLPVVNVGNRQRGRLHADNVQFVPHDERLIMEAVRRAVYDDAYRARVARCESPYGDGRAAARISETLASIPIDDRLLIKDITY